MTEPPGASNQRSLADVPDDISVTSTLDSQHDSEDEFTVERVLAEATDAEGDNWYLIQWTGYPMHRWTWEPEHNLHQPCLAEWKEIEQRQQRGEEQPFDTSLYDQAVEVATEARVERHRRRNLRRKREGLPLNLYEGEIEADYYLSDDNVGDGDFNVIIPHPSKQSSQKSPQPTSPVVDLTTMPPAQKPATENTSPERKIPPTKATKPPHKKLSFTGSAKHEPAQATTGPLPGKQRPAAGKDILRKFNSSAPRATGVLSGKVRPPANINRNVPEKGRSKGLKAKKSSAPAVVTSRHPSGNVFISGRKTRTHTKLGEAMSDKTKDPKHFSNFRITRKADLSSRDKADIAPADPSSLGLFNISTGVAYNTASSKSPDDSTPMEVDSPSVTGRTEQTKSAMKKSRISTSQNDDQERPPAKKARSVRFTGDEPTADGPALVTVNIIEDAEMVDEPASLDDSHDDFPPPPSPTPPRVTEGPGSQPFLNRPRQNMEKYVVLGPTGSKKVAMVFEDLPIGQDPWLSELANTEVLEITHSCTSQTFLSQSHILKEAVFSCGRVISSTGPDAIPVEVVAENLKLGSFGLVRPFENFAILLYPAKCEKWAATIPEAGPLSTSGALRYAVFKAPPRTGQLLKVPASFTVDLKRKPGGTRSMVVRELFALDYSQLLSPRLQATPHRHIFFLAFPSSREAVSNAIGAWLRDVNPQCRVFTSLIPGDWQAFTRQGSGVVIIHEKALPLVRLLPGLNTLLRVGERFYTLWKLQENLQWEHIPRATATSPPLALSRLFPHGTIVLLTPSFLVTQPCKAREFLLWYRLRLNRPGSNIHLAFSAGISEFLDEVAQEKARRRQLLLTASRSDARGLEGRAKEMGLTHEDCSARFDLIQIVGELINSSMIRVEGSDSFVFSDDCINPSDEQSLVNWFGYWSQTNLDRFRKFLVIGSRAEDAKRATRILSLPALQKGSSAKSARIAQSDMEMFGGHETEILGNDSARAFSDFLFHDRFHNHDRSQNYDRFQNQQKAPYFMKLYSYPVSYFHRAREMADHFGDTHSSFAAIETWFNWTHPFDYARRVNTQVCFFYTIDGEWEPEKYPESKFPPRRPWIGVYRIKKAARNPWTSTELLIWDPRAPEMCPPEGQPRLCHLMPAQRAMIQVVQHLGSKKNPSMKLEAIWLGGFNQSSTTRSTVIDRTLETIELMMLDPKTAMPSAENFLAGKGYKKVQSNAPRRPNEISSAAAALAAEMPSFGKPKPKSIIFHPPRNPDPRAATTDCENHFFQQVDGSKDPTVEFTFRPTLEWYGLQKKEGRGFEHFLVGPWEPMFKVLQIIPDGDTEGVNRHGG